MSPRRACARHGAPMPCARCKARLRERTSRRDYSDTAAYREVRAQALELYGETCVYCREPIDLDLWAGDRSLVLAHVTPHGDGGAFTVENVRPAHADCNRAAGRRPIPQELL